MRREEETDASQDEETDPERHSVKGNYSYNIRCAESPGGIEPKADGTSRNGPKAKTVTEGIANEGCGHNLSVAEVPSYVPESKGIISC